MIAGIYKITFTPSGDTYIGKSKDLENRWKQHIDSLNKGSHTKKLQEAFSRSEGMEFSVLAECHEDHIDLLEAYHISKLNPVLNSQLPENKYDWSNVPTEFLKLSTMEHYSKIRLAVANIEELRCKLEYVELELDEFKYNGKQGTLLKESESALDELQEEYEAVCSELNRWENAPWWKRIFM